MRARRRQRPAIAASAAALLLALPGVAVASRGATPQELEAMAGATGPPSDPACVTAFVSTVDDRWGVVRPRAGDGCPTVHVSYVLRRGAGGRWRELRQAARFTLCSRDVPSMPDRVGIDLGVCRPLSTRVYVAGEQRLAFKPRRIDYSAFAAVTRIRWATWGGSTATGGGTFVYRDRAGGFRVRVTIVLSKIDACGADRTYLARRVTAIRPEHRDEVAAYSARWVVRCPGGA